MNSCFIFSILSTLLQRKHMLLSGEFLAHKTNMLGNLYVDVVITNFHSCTVSDDRKVSTIRSTSDVEAAKA